MIITLQHDQVQRLRAYLDIAETLRNTFKLSGHAAELNCTIDDTHAMLCVMVDAKPATAVAVLTNHRYTYMTMDYHDDPLHPAATYKVEIFGHEVMVIANEAHKPEDHSEDALDMVASAVPA